MLFEVPEDAFIQPGKIQSRLEIDEQIGFSVSEQGTYGLAHIKDYGSAHAVGGKQGLSEAFILFLCALVDGN